MSNKAIKRKAAEHLGNGLPKQYAYDLLLAEYPEARPKKLAEVVRYMPSQQARERYRTMHLLLLAVVLLSAALRVAQPLLEPGFQWMASYRVLSLVPIASFFVGWSMLRWQGQVFEWVGWMNVLGGAGIIKGMQAWQHGGGDPWSTSHSVLSFVIGALALFLFYKVFAKPKEEKDPLGQGPVRYVFPEDGMT